MLKEPFSSEALLNGDRLKEKGSVGPILFSEGTYQVRVIDVSGEIYWPFLQISDEGALNDHFCSCQTTNEVTCCLHEAAAWIKIFGTHITPLHVRFRESLWNQLCQMGARRHGYDVTVLERTDLSEFQIFSTTKKRLVSLKPLTAVGKKFLEKIILERQPESEESSLKFSNLSVEELNLWREGRATHSLNYELSFWSDLAKGLMILQDEGKKYTIDFIYDEEGVLPKEITAQFEDIELIFYIAKVNWPKIIPSLATLNTPLKSYDFSHQDIQSISYDSTNKVLNLDINLQEKEGAVKSYPIGEWIFIPNKGFYPSKLDPLLKQKIVPSSQVGEFLTRHTRLVKKYLVGSRIDPNPVPARYVLSFDSDHSLHFLCYIFKKGDLQESHVASFIPWVYLGGEGFYRLEGLLFNEVTTTLPKEKVSAFVTTHRQWLHAFEGFQTHIIVAESTLTYFLSEENLHFEAKLEVAEKNEEAVSFDEWIYIKGRGFYSKIGNHEGSLVRGLTVPVKEISNFIDHHRDELENVPSFFAPHSPLKELGVLIYISEEETIIVEPRYTFLPFYEKKRVMIFNHYTYVEGEGFCRFPPDLVLPDSYSTKKIIDKDSELYFISYEIDMLKPFILEIDKRLQKPADLFLKINSLEKEEKGVWLIELEYQSDIGAVNIMTILDGLNKGKKYLLSSAGRISLKHSRYNWLQGISKKSHLQNKKKLRLTTFEWIRLFVFEEIQPPEDPESLQLWNEFKNFQTIDPLSLKGFKSHLRNYQESGLKWLWFLYCYQLSGLLCDEMGLGKTHQAMALLAAAHNKRPHEKFLVACPTTVIFHWESLLKKFLPDIRVYLYYGAQRTIINFEAKYDLLLTSYGTLRSKKKPLDKRGFDIAIFDEIQIAKNPSSQIHKTLKLIQASVRVGLTGTPIENNLFDLKALFDIVLPGYMPTQTFYKKIFINPIEKQQDTDKKQLLARFINPFILRRRKKDVLLELPEKMETIAYAPMSEEQKQLYKEVCASSKNRVLAELNDYSQPVPYLHIFSILTKLKQICDHPALFKNTTETYEQHASGKWDFFIELLEEIQKNGEKVVVFSQYLGMVDIIERHLKKSNIRFAKIVGATRNREEQVRKFHDDPQCTVFVGSLQAAGVGIDLVAASVVIHYDRGWNPAKENQASDRVHRIGQNRGVQIFKIISRGSIEEHIHHLIEKKLKLFEDFISSDDQNEIKSLTREELTTIFSLIDIPK